MATPIEIIRANLPGLPSEITDDTIQIIINSSASLHDAAIALCDSAASLAMLNSSDDLRLGSFSISGASKTPQYWLDLKDNLIVRKASGNGVITDPNTETPASAGFSVAINGDDIPRQTTTGEFRDPPEVW